MKKIYPFKFLDSYTQEDKDIFFGREEEIQNLYEMVFQSDLILIYGASGTGKTSLIQCGLASQFQSHDWLALSIRRNQNLNDSFEKVLREASQAGSAKPSSAQDTSEKRQKRDWLDDNWDDDEDSTDTSYPKPSKTLSPLAQELQNIYLKYFRPIYLIFDQFEELYVLGSKQEQEAFVQKVKEVMQVEQPVKMLFSIREEYLGYLYEFERAVPQLLRKKLRVEPMNLDKVQQVILGIDQNQQTNVSLKGSKAEKVQLAEAIFQKIRGEDKSLSIQLPYLQVFLDKLYRQSTGDNTFQQEAEFSLEALQAIGDIGNVLRDFLEEQVIRIAQKLQTKDENLWKILSPFATLEGTKEPLSLPMLQEKLSPTLKPLSAQAISAFENARILRYSEKDELYEVVHDTLAKQIAAKRSDEEIAILEIQTLIKNQLAFGKDLFSKKQINVILPYLDKLHLDREEKKLIADSQKEIQRQELIKKRRTRNIRIGVAAFVVLLLIASIFAIRQSIEANKQADIARKQSEKLEKEKEKVDAALSRFEEEKRKREANQVKILIQDANAYLGLGERKIALESLEAALRIDPDNREVRQKIAEIREEGR